MKRAALIAAVLFASVAASASAASFAPGDIVVYRIGDGVNTPAAGVAAPVFLDEYAPSGAYVQSIPLSGGSTPLTAIAAQPLEGLMTRSVDGRYLVVPGYPVATGAATSIATKAVQLIDSTGVPGAPVQFTDSSSVMRSAVSTDGSAIWFSTSVGVRYGTSTGGSPVSITSTGTPARALTIAAGQLYASSGGTPRIGSIGSGLPTLSGQTISGLPGYPNNGVPDQFVMLDLSSSVAGLDTMYVTDETAVNGGIQKYSLVSGSWTLNGTSTVSGVTFRGLTGSVSSGNVSLWATGAVSGGPSALYKFSDFAGYNGQFLPVVENVPSPLATNNTSFRGVALAPVSSTAVGFAFASARVRRHGVVVRWSAGRGAGFLGYSVLRERHGVRTRVSKALIPAAAIGGTDHLRFVDRGGRGGDRYFIAVRRMDGRQTMHGPVTATPANRH